MSLKRLYAEWGDELPLWEAAHEIDPWAPARIDRAAWELARALLARKGRSQDFDATREAAEPQSAEEMMAEAAAIAAAWPTKDKGQDKVKSAAPKT